MFVTKRRWYALEKRLADLERKMSKSKKKRRNTSNEIQTISFKTSISGQIPEGYSDYFLDEHMKIFENTLEETIDKFYGNKQNFICNEALKIFHRTQSEEIALRALELLETTAQPF